MSSLYQGLYIIIMVIFVQISASSRKILENAHPLLPFQPPILIKCRLNSTLHCYSTLLLYSDGKSMITVAFN